MLQAPFSSVCNLNSNPFLTLCLATNISGQIAPSAGTSLSMGETFAAVGAPGERTVFIYNLTHETDMETTPIQIITRNDAVDFGDIVDVYEDIVVIASRIAVYIYQVC